MQQSDHLQQSEDQQAELGHSELLARAGCFPAPLLTYTLHCSGPTHSSSQFD